MRSRSGGATASRRSQANWADKTAKIDMPCKRDGFGAWRGSLNLASRRRQNVAAVCAASSGGAMGGRNQKNGGGVVAGAGRVRIIAGAFRGRKLRFDAQPGLRPTPEVARERLFDWLGPRVVGAAVLDLFAGSGALGFEAASRGAGEVDFVEPNPASAARLLANAQLLGLIAGGSGPADPPEADAADGARRFPTTSAKARVERSRAKDFLVGAARLGKRYDLVFLDPPFAFDQWPDLLASLAQVLATDALVYAEAGDPGQFPAEGSGWEILRRADTGKSHCALMSRRA